MSDTYIRHLKSIEKVEFIFQLHNVPTQRTSNQCNRPNHKLFEPKTVKISLI